MWRGLFGKIAMAVLAVLLALNLLATFGARTAGKPAADTKIVYGVVRVDPSTNEDNLFREAGEKGWQLAGTIEIGGSTGYLVFRK
jgi:hypothetical protein